MLILVKENKSNGTAHLVKQGEKTLRCAYHSELLEIHKIHAFNLENSEILTFYPRKRKQDFNDNLNNKLKWGVRLILKEHIKNKKF